MRYAVITVDGELTQHDGELDWPAVIGVERKARVPLRLGIAASGWVNSVGLLYPAKYPRNVIGSCVLIALGARVQPYAGPVVLTGWNPRSLPEICSLPKPVDFLDTVHGDVVKALAGQTPRELSPSWAEQMREIADHVRTAPTPGFTVRTVKLP
ncbi:hypothetical protein ACIP4X_17655 [Streptomyces sp. NPDC088817]|uniref:hypothetical protein n=1 Tax=Streptomyces sp. NPDC088817 TaxID=3365907 RepID=UPI0038166F90